MHCIKTNFDKILAILKDVLGCELPACGSLRRPGPVPKFSDMEVVALSLTAECMGIDSESYLFSKIETTYQDDFPNMISRRQFNDRRKSLFHWQEKIRKCLSSILNAATEVFAIDSMPVEICKMSRKDRNKMGKEHEYTSPDKGYCASQNKWFYGYKLHCTCSPNGVIETLDIGKASVHDIHYLKDVRNHFKNCLIIGDKGYLNKTVKGQLFVEKGICLETANRNNQVEKKPMLYVLKKIRKRIETVFSQLCDQFMIQRNYAKSFSGFRTRVLSKVSAMTCLQYLNKFIKNQPVGRIKYALK
ncbi:IS982 family transposase [Terrimonas ferruginea]|uniref:IS982 family transposase n=1 Tax=Terrimonas ferruginea TaxID=249 RepID=UPI00048BB4E1